MRTDFEVKIAISTPLTVKKMAELRIESYTNSVDVFV